MYSRRGTACTVAIMPSMTLLDSTSRTSGASGEKSMPPSVKEIVVRKTPLETLSVAFCREASSTSSSCSAVLTVRPTRPSTSM